MIEPTALGGTAAAAVVVAHGAWWTLLSLAALPRPRGHARGARHWKFAVLVPAHDEERMIGACVRSLQAAAIGHDVQVIVVADNCSDETAAIAQGLGVRVVERFDTERRGKPYALDFGLAALEDDEHPPKAVAVVDADSEVSGNFFEALELRLESGAQAVQAHYQVANGDDPLVRLRRLAFLLAHYARPLGASRMGLGTTLKGNGMVFRWALVKDGFAGEGITEDAAATLALVNRGVKVEFEPRASVWGAMTGDYSAAGEQDRRWEGGRFALAPHAASAGAKALLRGELAGVASAFEVGSLPLTVLGGLAGIAAVLAAAGGTPWWLGVAAPASLVSYLAAGLVAARPASRDLAALREAPRYVAHKAAVYGSLLRSRPRTWERTRRS